MGNLKQHVNIGITLLRNEHCYSIKGPDPDGFESWTKIEVENLYSLQTRKWFDTTCTGTNAAIANFSRLNQW